MIHVKCTLNYWWELKKNPPSVFTQIKPKCDCVWNVKNAVLATAGPFVLCCHVILEVVSSGRVSERCPKVIDIWSPFPAIKPERLLALNTALFPLQMFSSYTPQTVTTFPKQNRRISSKSKSWSIKISDHCCPDCWWWLSQKNSCCKVYHDTCSKKKVKCYMKWTERKKERVKIEGNKEISKRSIKKKEWTIL